MFRNLGMQLMAVALAATPSLAAADGGSIVGDVAARTPKARAASSFIW